MKGKIKKLPGLFAKRLVHLSVLGDFLEITFPSLTQSRKIKELLEDLIINVDNIKVYDAKAYQNDYDVKLNGILYPNQYLSEINDKNLKIGDRLGLIVPNRANVTVGNYNISIGTHSAGTKVKFNMNITPFTEKEIKVKPQLSKKEVHRQCNYCGKEITDPNQLICEHCGSDLEEV